MLRLFLAAFVALIGSGTGLLALDFQPMSLDRMIRTADLVVAGSIDQASADRITLHVTDRIAGPQVGDSVTIKRNKDWSGRKGPGVFQEGQRLLVFATKLAAGSGAETPPWRTIGFENEGVLLIDAGYVFYSGGALEGFKEGTYDLSGTKITSYRFGVSDFVDAVRADRECFGRAGNDKNPGSAGARVLCSEAELEKFRNNTTLGPYLIKQAMQK
jgi:hypothetical protein